MPGLDIELAQLMEDVIGDLTAVPQPIEIKIFSEDAAQLSRLAHKVRAAIEKVPGVVDTRDGIHPAGDALEIHVDRAKAALEGMSPEAVTAQLDGYMAGVVTTQDRAQSEADRRARVAAAGLAHHGAGHRPSSAARARTGTCFRSSGWRSWSRSAASPRSGATT